MAFFAGTAWISRRDVPGDEPPRGVIPSARGWDGGTGMGRWDQAAPGAGAGSRAQSCTAAQGRASNGANNCPSSPFLRELALMLPRFPAHGGAGWFWTAPGWRGWCTRKCCVPKTASVSTRTWGLGNGGATSGLPRASAGVGHCGCSPSQGLTPHPTHRTDGGEGTAKTWTRRQCPDGYYFYFF